MCILIFQGALGKKIVSVREYHMTLIPGDIYVKSEVHFWLLFQCDGAYRLGDKCPQKASLPQFPGAAG